MKQINIFYLCVGFTMLCSSLRAEVVTADSVEIGGTKYETVVMKDGRTWMAENLRYVPEGKSITPLNQWDAEAATGIFYPAVFAVDENGTATVTASDDEAAIRRMGLLYTADAVMNGTALPTEDFADAESLQGIAPEGWHVPTAQEWIDLVGACAASAYTNTDAPYYMASLSGASLDSLNADGFNLLPYPYIFANQNKYLGTWLNKTPENIYSNYCSMAYFASSTARSATQNYAAMITNNATKSSVNVSYNFLNNAVSVRFIKDKEDKPTDMQNNSVSVPHTGIYNLMGVYLGEDATNLPQGIYIINGKKAIR